MATPHRFSSHAIPSWASSCRLVLFAGILILLSIPVTSIADTELLWSFSGNGSLECIAAFPDIDGDGGPDIVFEGYGSGPSGVDHVFAIRGASVGVGEVLWSARPIGGASSGGGDGDNCLRLGPDLNGDGFPEVLLATAWGGRTAYALDGLTGGTVWSFDTYEQPQSGWVYAMDDLGSDLTGDGVPEIVICCGSYNDRVYCLNGATGAQVWTFNAQDASFDIRSCQDINNDGIRDVVVGLGDDSVSRQVIALSGANGQVLWSRPTGGTVWNLTFVSDLDGDGIREIVPALWTGTLMCINGRTGAVEWSVSAPYQQRVATLDDVNGDGYDDVVVGLNTSTGVRAYDGASGALLWTAVTSDWAWAVDRVADCTEDGINDAVAGDFDGRVYLIDGVSGQIVWNWLNPTGDKIMTIRGVPDLNGNGQPDVVGGTQLLYSPPTGGNIYALEGNNEPMAAPDRVLTGPVYLSPAHPNPACGRVAWRLDAREAGQVRLLVFGADGRRVADAGHWRVASGTSLPLSWNGCDDLGRPVAAGVYHTRILLDGRIAAEGRVVQMR
jgi:outer membrane protein assembly factor BamB